MDDFDKFFKGWFVFCAVTGLASTVFLFWLAYMLVTWLTSK